MRILTWPFRMLFGFIGFLFGFLGRLLSLILGLVLAFAGALLCMTVVGAIVGIPLAGVGIMLFVRSFF